MRTWRYSGGWSQLTSLMIVLGCAAAKASATTERVCASAATERVCAHGCPYAEIRAAVAAAAPGDPFPRRGRHVRRRLYDRQGPDADRRGPARTVIRGGGPVITVGVLGASTEPTVSISAVTATGGANRTLPNGSSESLGGGVLVPPGAVVGPDGEFAPRATLTIERSVISGNAVAPSSAIDAGFSCGAGDCQFAHAGGGGLDSWGDVTLRNSRVSGDAAAGPLTSDANSGGIYAQQSALVVDRSEVTNNQATAIAPNGRFAAGAGIMFDTFSSPPGTCRAPQQGSGVFNNSLLEMDRVLVAGNTGRANAPSGVAQGGGIYGTASTSPGPTCSSRSTTARCSATASPRAQASRPRAAASTPRPGDANRDEGRVQPPGSVRRLLAGDADDASARSARRSGPRLAPESRT